MNSDLEKAKEILNASSYTCVLAKGSEIYTSTKRGVSPLLEWLDSEKNFEGFSAADKVVGKAATHLYLLLGIKVLYANVISSRALELLLANGLDVYYGETAEWIKNRSNTGFCPMELCVADIDNAEDALAAIKNKLEELKRFS